MKNYTFLSWIWGFSYLSSLAVVVADEAPHHYFRVSDFNELGRDSCGTLHSCLDCVAAGCSWTKTLVPLNDIDDVTESSNERSGATVTSLSSSLCMESCAGAGTDASCFRLEHYQGLTSDEICQIAHRPVTTAPQPLEATAEEEEPQEAPEPPMLAAEYPISAPTNHPTVGPTTTPTITVQDEITVYKNDTDTPAKAPMPNPCTGFISCHHCWNNTQLACAFVASEYCQDICPELAHVPCYELHGNYSTTTIQDDVCTAAEINENDSPSKGSTVGFSQVATHALAASNSQASAAVPSYTSWGLERRISTGGVITAIAIAACLLPGCYY